MSEMSFEQMLEESFKTIHNGEVVDGTVISVKPDEIVLNIGKTMVCVTQETLYDNIKIFATMDDFNNDTAANSSSDEDKQAEEAAKADSDAANAGQAYYEENVDKQE